MPKLKTKKVTKATVLTEPPVSRKIIKKNVKTSDQPTLSKREDLKLWLGMNNVDAVANIGTIPFLIGYFMHVNFAVTVFLFLITFFSYAYTVIMYFAHYDEKYTRSHWEWNKWITLIVTVFITGIMIAIVNTKYHAQLNNNTDCRGYLTTNCVTK
jgi:hypothetical protein